MASPKKKNHGWNVINHRCLGTENHLIQMFPVKLGSRLALELIGKSELTKELFMKNWVPNINFSHELGVL